MGEAWRKVVASGILDAPCPRCSDPPPRELLDGIELFNAGQYYECHEVLEAIWHQDRESIRYLYQGILQIGVGFHHLRNRNERGARLLLTDGIEKVARFVPSCMGIDTERLRAESQACLDQLIALGPERLSDFNWTSVPRVRLIERPP